MGTAGAPGGQPRLPNSPAQTGFEYHIAQFGVPSGLMRKGRADPPSMVDGDCVQGRGGGFGGRGAEGMEYRWPPTVPLALARVN